jgi:hypothetical protein
VAISDLYGSRQLRETWLYQEMLAFRPKVGPDQTGAPGTQLRTDRAAYQGQTIADASAGPWPWAPGDVLPESVAGCEQPASRGVQRACL